MLVRRLLYKKQLWHASYNCTTIRHMQSINQLEEAVNLTYNNVRLSAIEKEPQRQPFAKNLFLGVVDHEFIYYPEPQTKERHTQFFEWLKPIEKYVSDLYITDPQNANKVDILTRLKDFGFFRANVSEEYLGLQLSQTELAMLTEMVSCFPWLASYFVKNHVIPIHIISILASDEQKAKYLPKIISGDIIPTVCFTDSSNGINISNIHTRAVLSDCEKYWILNGEKSFVTNGYDSNLFLVFAQCGHDYSVNSTHKILSVFLVERDFDGITYKNSNTLVGQQDIPICTISFKDTKIPKENLLGKIGDGLSILIDSLSPGNRNIAPQAVGILKVFIKLLTTHMIQRKHLDKNLHESEIIQEVIGKIAVTLYGMESMLYMTTGMIDKFENQDCVLEKAMTEAYCVNECVACIYNGLQIIGAHSYLKDNPYMHIFEHALSYTLFDSYNVDSSVYASLLGLQHTGKNLHKHIFKLRNPFFYPKYIMKMFTSKEFQLKLHLSEHVHPSFQPGALLLEQSIGNLANSAVILLERHGMEVTQQQMELRKLSELAIQTFALVAVLSRASRSYCIGLRNADQDRHLANSFGIFAFKKIQSLAEEIEEGNQQNGDRLYKDIAQLMYNKKDYFAEHPLNRTY